MPDRANSMTYLILARPHPLERRGEQGRRVANEGRADSNAVVKTVQQTARLMSWTIEPA